MREAIGGSLLLNIVIVFVSIIILLFIQILTYSKAYKAKNRIISVIEEYEEYTELAKGTVVTKDNAEDVAQITNDLSEMGYQVASSKKCSSENLNITNHNYCIYKVCLNSADCKKGYYYKVSTFVHFEFPIIGKVYNPEVHGETKIFHEEYDY